MFTGMFIYHISAGFVLRFYLVEYTLLLELHCKFVFKYFVLFLVQTSKTS